MRNKPAPSRGSIRFHRLIAPVAFVLFASAAPAVTITTYDFEGGTMPGWGVVPTGVGDDSVFANGPLSVEPTAYETGSIQGDWIVRTWNQNDGANVTSIINDGPTGGVRTDVFVLPDGAVVDFLIGGGNHPWPGVADPDLLTPGPACFNLERLDGTNDWETIFTATGPNANTLAPAQFTAAQLAPYVGDTVRFAIYDLASGGWGHIDIDNIVLSGTADIFDPADSEPDNMGDNFENFFFGNLDRDGTLDFDNDGRTDLQEFDDKTNPIQGDSDGDGLNDGGEAAAGSNPNNPDTDGDGWNDGDEVAAGSSPTDPSSVPTPIVQRTWDFETGDLSGWTVIQTTHGDNTVYNGTSQPADTGSASAYNYGTVQGEYFIRTWDGTNDTVYAETDGPTGIIESEEFVLGSLARFDFLIGGGNHPFSGDPDTPEAGIAALTLERKVADDDWEAIFTSTGPNANSLAPDFWDAGDHVGETVRLRIYDTVSSSWGHIDVDDIRYSALVDDNPFLITDISFDPMTNEVTLIWNSNPGVTYAIDYSNDLVFWPEVVDGLPGQAGQTSYSFTAISDFIEGMEVFPRSQSYRVRIMEGN